jgi:hypothetical protein
MMCAALRFGTVLWCAVLCGAVLMYLLCCAVL